MLSRMDRNAIGIFALLMNSFLTLYGCLSLLQSFNDKPRVVRVLLFPQQLLHLCYANLLTSVGVAFDSLLVFTSVFLHGSAARNYQLCIGVNTLLNCSAVVAVYMETHMSITFVLELLGSSFPLDTMRKGLWVVWPLGVFTGALFNTCIYFDEVDLCCKVNRSKLQHMVLPCSFTACFALSFLAFIASMFLMCRTSSSLSARRIRRHTIMYPMTILATMFPAIVFFTLNRKESLVCAQSATALSGLVDACIYALICKYNVAGEYEENLEDADSSGILAFHMTIPRDTLEMEGGGIMDAAFGPPSSLPVVSFDVESSRQTRT